MTIRAGIDEFDRRIISALQADGRMSNVDLAVGVGLSPSPCLRRVRLLEQAGIIRGYRAVLNRPAVGLAMTVFIEINISRHTSEAAAKLQQLLVSLPGCVACHLVSGSADFLVEMVVPDLATYESIITTHLLVSDDIANIRSNFSMRPVTVDGPLMLPA